MKNLTTIGIDIAKNYLQIHGENASGKTVLTKRIARDKFLAYMANLPKCLVGMEACGGANYWAKELIKLGFEVKLMSAEKVKKFVGHNKNDANDAAACAAAVRNGKMTFVAVRTEAQLAIQALHRTRSYYVKQRTGMMNMSRGILLELGIAIKQGRSYLLKKINELIEPENEIVSVLVKEQLQRLKDSLQALNVEIEHYTEQLENRAKGDEDCQLLQTIEGIGPLSSSALIAKIGKGNEFKCGRELSAYLGLVPKQKSSGEKQRMLGISKHGDRYVRQLLIHGGRSAVKAALRKNKITGQWLKVDVHSVWLRQLAERVGMNKASVAVANKNARMVVAMLKNRNEFQASLAH